MKNKSQLFIYILLNCFLISLFNIPGCSFFHNPVQPISVKVGFCVDIVGIEEPVFTKPMLEAFYSLENKGLIKLEIQTCHFASDYENTLAALAKRNQVVFCGPLLFDRITQVAKANPETYFVLMQAIPEDLQKSAGSLPNLQWLLYRKEDIASVMGKICSYYPEPSDIWLVTDLPSGNPIRLFEENAFFKVMQTAKKQWSLLEWPVKKASREQGLITKSITKPQLFCVTEGVYVPSFINWIQQLPQEKILLILPDGAWDEWQVLPILGSVLKEYEKPLENIIQQFQTKTWKEGIHYIGKANKGFRVKLSKDLWESTLRNRIEKELNPASFQEEKRSAGQ